MSYIGVCQCDECREEKITVIHKHMDTPVLAVCRDCNPRSFEEHAKRDIDIGGRSVPAGMSFNEFLRKASPSKPTAAGQAGSSSYFLNKYGK